MKKLFVCLSVCLFAGSANAEVISFTPSGVSTVSQNVDLYWDMLSDATSTSSFGAVGDFNLSDHGDFHFDTLAADMINIGSGTGGAVLSFGDTIGAASNFSNTSSYVGTTDFSGVMNIGDTAYFGLSFELLGQTHYGWVQIVEDTTTQSILGWGYESVAGQSITAGAIAAPVPEPSTYAMMALGLLAVAGMSRRKNQA